MRMLGSNGEQKAGPLPESQPSCNSVLLYIDASIYNTTCVVEGNVDVEETRSLHVASRETWPRVLTWL